MLVVDIFTLFLEKNTQFSNKQVVNNSLIEKFSKECSNGNLDTVEHTSRINCIY